MLKRSVRVKMALLFVVAITASMIAIPCSIVNAQSDQTELTFWALSSRQEAYEQIEDRYNEENPDVKIVTSYYSTDGIKDACKVSASSDSLPDFWFNWGGSLGRFYSDNGLTYDLSEYSNENGWQDKFNPSAIELCTFNDELIGYPTSFNVLGIFYRKDIFEEYNLEIPETFEEFEEVCATLKENGITPISTAGLNGWHVMRFVELFIEHYAGSELHDQLNLLEESWDNEVVTQAFTKYKEFVDKGYFPEGFVTLSPDDTLILLSNGTCAMDIQGQWYDGNIISNGLDVENFGSFAFPSGDSNRLSSFVEMTQFNKNLDEDKLAQAIKYTDYMFSPEIANEYKDYYNLPLPLVDAEMPEGQPNVSNLIGLSQKNGTFTILDQAFPTEISDVLFSCQDAVATGSMEPADVGATLQDAIEAYLAK